MELLISRRGGNSLAACPRQSGFSRTCRTNVVSFSDMGSHMRPGKSAKPLMSLPQFVHCEYRNASSRAMSDAPEKRYRGSLAAPDRLAPYAATQPILGVALARRLGSIPALIRRRRQECCRRFRDDWRRGSSRGCNLNPWKGHVAGYRGRW